jgi:hypothetical protein
MPKSTSILADLNTAISNGPAGNTLANAIAAAGPIQDYVGNCYALKLKFQSASNLLGGDTVIKGSVKQVTDTGDSANLTLINKLIAILNGTSTPSTAALADSGTLASNTQVGTGVGAATLANAIAPAGPIQDYAGNCSIIQKKFQEAQVLLTKIVAVTDSSGDATNFALLNNILLALV